MSYCRFGVHSDVYCYQSEHGDYVVHVARTTFKDEHTCPEFVLGSGLRQDELMERYNAYREWVEKAERVPVGLSRDGTSHYLESAIEAAEILISLKKEGYKVPTYAIEHLLMESEQ